MDKMEKIENGAQMQAFVDGLQNSQPYQFGNSAEFEIEKQTYNASSPLQGKKIGFLGSSITYGAFSHGISFVDYLQACDGVDAVKSAVSGTTLAGNDADAYLTRFGHDFKPDDNYDLIVCQLSTNDGRQGKKLGEIAQTNDFDLNTTIGAIEFLCHEVQTRFNCPIVFYTCVDTLMDPNYAKLVQILYQLSQKWNFSIIDLYNDRGVLAATKIRKNAMFDNIHPTQEGYLKIWLPFFEKWLGEILSNK